MDTREGKNPLMVSVRCATYNHVNYIRQCLDGIVSQKTDFRFEAIVHDDASTDGTTEIVREYAEKYPDIIKPMYESENQYSKNVDDMNRRINERLVGKYIAICEGDDFWIDTSKLQKQVDALEAHPECKICYCRVQRVNKDGQIIKNLTIPWKNKMEEGFVSLKDLFVEEFYNGRWCFHTSSFLFYGNLYVMTKERQEFYSKFPYGDMPTQLWCLLHGKGYFVDSIGSCYRFLSGGYNSTIRINTDFAIRQERKLISALFFLDEYTLKKFHQEIAMRILRANYDMERYTSHELAIYKPKYWALAKKMTIREHVSLLLKNMTPLLYKYIKGIKANYLIRE